MAHELIIRNIQHMRGAYVRCTHCNGKFFKIPKHFHGGQPYNYCPLCGEKVVGERFEELDYGSI